MNKYRVFFNAYRQARKDGYPIWKSIETARYAMSLYIAMINFYNMIKDGT